jgi:hypothetical protein
MVWGDWFPDLGLRKDGGQKERFLRLLQEIHHSDFRNIIADILMMKINASVDIASSPDDIFHWIDNPDKAMRWQKGVKNGVIIKETPEKTGTTFREELEENGQSLVMNGEITGYIPNTSIAFHLESKIHSVFVTYFVVGNPDKSTVTVNAAIKWKFPLNILTLVMGRKIKAKILKQTESELSDLKKLCEKG